MAKLQLFIKAIYAGFMIGIGGIVYLSVENKVIGSLLFSFGLLTIVTQGFALYTGKIGFIKSPKELFDMLIIIAGNFAGTFLTAVLAKAAHLNITTAELVDKKLDNTIWNVFLLAIFCGVMMYLAIDNFNKAKNHLFIIAPVMIFILSGFEHSIADMFYFHLAGAYQGKAFLYLGVMLLGNGIGAVLFKNLVKFGALE
ncbi:MAG: formate/nitrite transporter family protein [Lachnospiraceae bacterium]|jgi:formate/nitrite transporter FocA (FNT family)|nr:formate/nitrite transporter family protein [Lachnospiraceae bacterium]MCX4315470.1 formate/nitrite transporter family protein [Lachnospiraceae bacterium]